MKITSFPAGKARSICLVAVLFFTGITAYCQDFTREDFIADLDYLEKTLPEKHINLFAKISPEEYAEKIAALRDKSGELDTDGFMAGLYWLMTAIGDEHTSIEPRGQIIAPIRFGVFDEGIFVTGIESSRAGLLLSELTMINGRPAKEVVAELSSVVQSENPSFFNVMMPYRLSNLSVLRGIGIIGPGEEAVYTLSGSDGTINNVNFGDSHDRSPMTPVPGRRPKDSKSRYYWYRYIPDRDVLYFNYANCREDKEYPFGQFNTDMFATIKEKHPQRIIIDLRENGGGNSRILEPFLDSLRKSYLNREGRLYVLIGKRTFSSALLNALTLKLKYPAILLGEPTGGSVNHYGEIQSFELPRTKARVVYSTKYFQRIKGADGPLVPDIEIPDSVRDLESGTDGALNYIFLLPIP